MLCFLHKNSLPIKIINVFLTFFGQFFYGHHLMFMIVVALILIPFHFAICSMIYVIQAFIRLLEFLQGNCGEQVLALHIILIKNMWRKIKIMDGWSLKVLVWDKPIEVTLKAIEFLFNLASLCLKLK